MSTSLYFRSVPRLYWRAWNSPLDSVSSSRLPPLLSPQVTAPLVSPSALKKCQKLGEIHLQGPRTSIYLFMSLPCPCPGRILPNRPPARPNTILAGRAEPLPRAQKTLEKAPSIPAVVKAPAVPGQNPPLGTRECNDTFHCEIPLQPAGFQGHKNLVLPLSSPPSLAASRPVNPYPHLSTRNARP